MKWIKSYFLFFSLHPVLYSFLETISLVVLCALFGLFNLPVSGFLFFCSFLLFFILHISLVYYVSNKYIIRSKNEIFSEIDDHEKDWFRMVLLEDGRLFKLLTKPLWAKGKVFYVYAPRDYQLLFEKEIEKITCDLSLSGKYKNSTFSLPVRITLKLSGPLCKEEFFSVLLGVLSGQTSVFLFEDYARIVFDRVNKPNQKKINEILGKYSRMEISQPAFLDEIVNVVVFPERIFSNVTDVSICLGNPVFSSCKGLSCPGVFSEAEE